MSSRFQGMTIEGQLRFVMALSTDTSIVDHYYRGLAMDVAGNVVATQSATVENDNQGMKTAENGALLVVLGALADSVHVTNSTPFDSRGYVVVSEEPVDHVHQGCPFDAQGNIAISAPPLGPELAINGDFDTDVTGYLARAASTIAWDPTQAMLIDVLGAGGGFLSDPIPPTTPFHTYRFSITMKGVGYLGGFKFRLAELEGLLTDHLTTDAVTYTVDVHTEYSNQSFEIFRSAADTGTLLVDNISIRQVLT